MVGVVGLCGCVLLTDFFLFLFCATFFANCAFFSWGLVVRFPCLNLQPVRSHHPFFAKVLHCSDAGFGGGFWMLLILDSRLETLEASFLTSWRIWESGAFCLSVSWAPTSFARVPCPKESRSLKAVINALAFSSEVNLAVLLPLLLI